MEPYLESLKNSVEEIRIADHMLYVTYPVIKDKRLLLKTTEHIFTAVVSVINSILQYDYINRRITLCKGDAYANFSIFVEKCSRRYNISPEEIAEIREIVSLMESHKKSPVEFLRKEKVVIMSDSLKTAVIEPEKLKKYLGLAKKLVEKARFGLGVS